jgi:glycosyltransferase involved in cell wall biosynthesis
MRIAILGTRGIPARYGGFETFAEQLSVRLVQHGIDVTVYCERTTEAHPISDYKGVQLRYLPAPRMGPLSTILFDIHALWDARSQFDLVYMLGYGASAFCWIPRLFGTEVWINMDGLEWRRTKWSRLARTYLHVSEAIAMLTPNRIVADARAIKESLESRYRKLPPCDVIPYGCEVLDEAPDLALLRDLGLEPKSYYVVVCRFEPENHVREIVQGFKASRSKFKLVLVGDSASPSAYVATLTEMRDHRVHFLGTIYDKERLSALRYHSVAYVHGHSVGGTNPSLLESMGCGNFVIAHDNCFNREVLADTAVYFKDARTLTSSIEEFESGKLDPVRMSAASMERVAQYYNWERIADAYRSSLDLSIRPVHEPGQEIDYGPAHAGHELA